MFAPHAPASAPSLGGGAVSEDPLGAAPAPEEPPDDPLPTAAVGAGETAPEVAPSGRAPPSLSGAASWPPQAAVRPSVASPKSPRAMDRTFMALSCARITSCGKPPTRTR